MENGPHFAWNASLATKEDTKIRFVEFTQVTCPEAAGTRALAHASISRQGVTSCQVCQARSPEENVSALSCCWLDTWQYSSSLLLLCCHQSQFQVMFLAGIGDIGSFTRQDLLLIAGLF